MLSPGQITFVVIARQTSNEGNRRLNAGIGVAKPKNEESYGYLSELHCFGKSCHDAEEEVEDLAASMLASTLGIPFNIDAAWDEKRQIFKMSDLFVETKSNVSSAVVEKDGEFTTVVSLAVFIPE
jgi:arginine decarboxylase